MNVSKRTVFLLVLAILLTVGIGGGISGSAGMTDMIMGRRRPGYGAIHLPMHPFIIKDKRAPVPSAA